MGGLTGNLSDGPSSRRMPLASDSIAEVQGQIRAQKALGVTPEWVISGLDEDRPDAGYKNRLYISIDGKHIYLDSGTDWITII